MKDTTAFRERFNRWKAGEKVYEAGLPTYKDGKSLTDEEYYGIMERVALDNNAEWNKYRLEEGVRTLSADEEVMRVLNDHSYDYRGYYNKYPDSAANASTHWPDEFKTYLHPTFSDESRYAANNSKYIGKTKFNPYGFDGGHWNNEQFKPAKWQLKVPAYKNGRDVTNQLIIDHAWAVENPTRRGLNPDGTWSQYPDPAGGGLMDVGAGSLVDNEAARKAGRIGVVPDKKFYTTKEVNEPWIKNYQEGWPNIAKSYDEKYGTRAYPHPSDTINPQTRLLAVSTRGKTGKLKLTKWPAFYQAIADGDIAKQLIESRTKFGENEDLFDNDRIRREAEALWPGRFNVTWDEKNPKKKAIVTPKFQGGKESEIYGGTLPEILVTPKGVGHNYEVVDNREMIPTGALYSDAERHETEGKLGGDYVRENLHEVAPVVFDLLSSVEPIANPMATASAVKGLYDIVRHPKTITQNIVRGFKNPISVKTNNNVYGYGTNLDFSYKYNVSDLYERLQKKAYGDILRDVEPMPSMYIPESHKGIRHESLPNWVKDELRSTTYPRMKELRPWMSDNAFKQEFEQAIDGGYKSVPQTTMNKALEKSEYKGVYIPDVDKITIVDGYEDFALPHEVRHKIDNHIPLTEEETDILLRAYNEYFDNLGLDIGAGMDPERVTTNRDARENLLSFVNGSYKDYKQLNEIIDSSSSDEIIDAVKNANGYGKAYISKLEELGRLNKNTESRNLIVQLIKNAMKRVGILTGSTYIPAKILLNPVNSKKK